MLAVVVLAMAAMWIYAWSPLAERPPADYLGDRSLASDAEAVCASSRGRIEALPKAFSSPDNVARAAVIAQANDELRSMLAQIRARPMTTERDRTMMTQWLADYDRYLANRDDYASRLARDPAARFYVDQKGAKQITEPIDGFARSNHMSSCTSPDDLA